jgi:CO/xanthine dehydrogenase Mo-binding subunit
MRQILANELAIEPERIDIGPVPTDVAPFDLGSGGSRVTHVAGRAIFQAVEQIRSALLPVAADLLEAPVEIVEWDQGDFVVRDRPDLRVDLRSVAAVAVQRSGGPIEGAADYETEWPEENEYAALVADVSVDPQTGQVTVNRLIMAQDVGFAINPVQVEGQIQGGIVQGLGYSLSEDLQTIDGLIANGNLGEYKVPSMPDVPPLEVILVEGGQSAGPYGAKSVGELPIIPVAAAIANGVFAACGVRVTDLPITAEKVLAGLRARNAASASSAV